MIINQPQYKIQITPRKLTHPQELPIYIIITSNFQCILAWMKIILGTCITPLVVVLVRGIYANSVNVAGYRSARFCSPHVFIWFECSAAFAAQLPESIFQTRSDAIQFWKGNLNGTRQYREVTIFMQRDVIQ